MVEYCKILNLKYANINSKLNAHNEKHIFMIVCSLIFRAIVVVVVVVVVFKEKKHRHHAIKK